MHRTPEGFNLLRSYCDKCADDRNFPTKEKKVKGTCIMCGFTGLINEVQNSEISDYSDFNEEIWEGGGFHISQLDPFPLGQIRETIHPTLTHKLLTEKIAIFFDKNVMIVANPQTGQQVQIMF